MCAKFCTLWMFLLLSVATFGQNNVIDEVVWVVGEREDVYHLVNNESLS